MANMRTELEVDGKKYLIMRQAMYSPFWVNHQKCKS
jgi:hypothetical protein